MIHARLGDDMAATVALLWRDVLFGDKEPQTKFMA